MNHESPNERLERMVDELASREAIRELIARYGMAVDDRDMESLQDCFCEDGKFRYADGSVVLDGREAVLGYYSQRLGQLGASYHYPHSTIIDFASRDEASGIVNAHAELGMPSGDTFWVALRYHDNYRRQQGRWRFADREIHLMYYLSLADLPAALTSPLRKRMTEPHRIADIPEGLESWQKFRGR